MRKTLKKVLAEYGAIAVVLYLTIFFAVFIGAYFALQLGWAPENVVGTAGAWTAAYLITKVTQPLRIASTVVLTTFLGKLWDKRRKPEIAGQG